MKREKFTDYRVIKKDDSDYPKRLERIKGAPERLYEKYC